MPFCTCDLPGRTPQLPACPCVCCVAAARCARQLSAGVAASLVCCFHLTAVSGSSSPCVAGVGFRACVCTHTWCDSLAPGSIVSFIIVCLPVVILAPFFPCEHVLGAASGCCLPAHRTPCTSRCQQASGARCGAAAWAAAPCTPRSAPRRLCCAAPRGERRPGAAWRPQAQPVTVPLPPRDTERHACTRARKARQSSPHCAWRGGAPECTGPLAGCLMPWRVISVRGPARRCLGRPVECWCQAGRSLRATRRGCLAAVQMCALRVPVDASVTPRPILALALRHSSAMRAPHSCAYLAHLCIHPIVTGASRQARVRHTSITVRVCVCVWWMLVLRLGSAGTVQLQAVQQTRPAALKKCSTCAMSVLPQSTCARGGLVGVYSCPSIVVLALW